MSDSVDHESMLMKPGATARPLRVDHRFRFRRFEIADTGDAIAANRDIDMSRLRRRCRRKPFRSG